MTEEHANVSLLKQLDLRNLAAATDLFAEDVVWHYFNPNLPDVHGDYVGLAGIGNFFEAVGKKTGGAFRLEPISVTAVGEELVVAHTRNTMTIQDRPIALDVVTVWRIVDGRIAEVWDIIPTTYSNT
ncbi:MAG: nuclear transport factor 2 family protein [Hyphomicrobiales bacterium]|nr:nuclear transport factor 2 family protein [Hyphomicrobiales bacterium]